MDKIVIGTETTSSGLGDILLLTPICRELDCIVELTPTANNRFGSLFNGIAEVRQTNNPHVTKNIGTGHYALRKMRNFGLDNKSYLPYVKITSEERYKAESFLKPYINPIIFVPNTSLTHKNVREFDQYKWQEMINVISKKRDILQFGISNNFTPFLNTIKFKDIDIRDTAAIYSVINDYIGVDTGDMHLMLAVGGNVNVLVPKSNNIYNRNDWNYDHKKANYIEFDDYNKLVDYVI